MRFEIPSAWILAPVALLLGLGAGFAAGLTCHRQQVQQAPAVIAAPARPRVDVSPAGSPSTVILPEVRPVAPAGIRAAAPVPVPDGAAVLGHTTATAAGVTFHSITLAAHAGEALELRPMVWAEDATGARVPVEGLNLSAPLVLPGPHRARWGIGAGALCDARGWRLAALATYDAGRIQWTAAAVRDGGMLAALWRF